MTIPVKKTDLLIEINKLEKIKERRIKRIGWGSNKGQNGEGG